MHVSVDLIRQFAFFQGLSDETLLSIANQSQLASAQQNKEILARGSLINFLTFIISGRIQSAEIAEDGRIFGINILASGDIIGLLTLVDGQHVTNILRTLEDTRLLLLPMATAKHLVSSQPLIAQKVMQMLALSVRHSTRERSMLSLPNAFHRIFVKLNLLVNSSSPQRQIHHFPRQQDIAIMVNTSRETVSRALQLLIKNGVLTKNGHQLQIQQSEALKKLADDGLDALINRKNL